jgi:hypothetical protein
MRYRYNVIIGNKMVMMTTKDRAIAKRADNIGDRSSERDERDGRDLEAMKDTKTILHGRTPRIKREEKNLLDSVSSFVREFCTRKGTSRTLVND